MLPESPEGKKTYVECRDYCTRWRQMAMARFHGDLDAFRGYVLDGIASDSELAAFREATDFARDEELFTPEMLEAAENVVNWGARLRTLALEAKGSL